MASPPAADRCYGVRWGRTATVDCSPTRVSSLSTSAGLYRTVPTVQPTTRRLGGGVMPTGVPTTGGRTGGPLPGAGYALALLLSINLFNYIDRQILSATLPKLQLDAALFDPTDANL